MKEKMLLIIIGNAPEFITSNDPVLDILVRFSKFNSKKIENIAIEKNLFKMLDRSIINSVNPKYKKFALDNDLVFLDRFEIACDLEKQSCKAFDEKGYKIYFDYGHFTLKGAKFLGEKIHKEGWLKLK